MITNLGDPQDKINKLLLNNLQTKFPITSSPFHALGDMIKISGEEVIKRISLLKENKVIRQISAIFDTRQLGYESSLVAAKADPDKIDQSAKIINEHPGVSHNYRRNHAYNLWFTIAVPPTSAIGLQKSVELLGTLANLNNVRILPSIKLYKIGLMLDMADTGDTIDTSDYIYTPSSANFTINTGDISCIKALQEDIPLVSSPFSVLAAKHNISETDLINAANKYITNGTMRRFAAVLFHKNAGFSTNIMGVWNVPQNDTEKIGRLFATYKAVSHCYLRPVYEDWPYNIFTMLHAKSEESLQKIMNEMSELSNIKDFASLKSLTEYKKVRVTYFSEEFQKWENKHI